MKKLAAILSLALSLYPSVALAQSIGPYQTPTGGWDVPTNTTAGTINDSSLTSGDCVQASTAGLLTTTAAACAGNASPFFPSTTQYVPYSFDETETAFPDFPFMYIMNNNNIVTITGFKIACLPYVPAFIGAPFLNYPYTAETNGVGAGDTTVLEFVPGQSTYNTIGVVTLPPSPHGGPYVSNASVTLGSPYTTHAGGLVTAYITEITDDDTEGYADCVVTATLK